MYDYQSDYKKNLRRVKRFIKDAEDRGYSFDLPEHLNEILSGEYEYDDPKTAARVLKGITPEKLYDYANYMTDEGDIISGQEGRNYERSKAAKKGWETRNKAEDTPISEIPEDQIDPQPMGDKIIENVKNSMTGSDKNTSNLPEDKDAIYKILNWTQEEIEKWPSGDHPWSKDLFKLKEQDKDNLAEILDGAIASQGFYTVARRMEENAMAVTSIVTEVLYGSGGGSRESFSNGREQVQINLAWFRDIVYGREMTEAERLYMSSLEDSYVTENFDVDYDKMK